MQVVLILALALTACDGPKPADDTGADDTGGGADLPKLMDGVDTEGCEGYTDSEDGTFYEIPGAASYFYGLYERSGEAWTGEEVWYLFANPTWQETGEDDCEVHYAAEASETTASACPSCDLALAVTLTLDVTLSTCPEDLYDGTDGDVIYGIKYVSDDEAEWYFGTSGDELGAGYYDEDAVNFLSDKKCMWF